MKIKLVSDLHLEFTNYYMDLPNDENADVLILAGDICVGVHLPRYEDFFRYVSEHYESVIYVLGNHEFYHGCIDQECLRIKNQLYLWGLLNITVLENTLIDIKNVVFIGATLWTGNSDNNPNIIEYVKKYMNDYRFIRFSFDVSQKEKFSPYVTSRLHNISLNEIANMLEEFSDEDDVDIVVVTHHLPSAKSIDPKYKDDWQLNPAFYSNLDNFIEEYPKIKLWCHGHTHCSNDYIIGNTRVVSNPRGYVNAGIGENPNFNPGLILEV